MLRRHTKKLRLETETIRVLTRLDAALVVGGKTATSDLCSPAPTLVVGCDATDGCPNPP